MAACEALSRKNMIRRVRLVDFGAGLRHAHNFGAGQIRSEVIRRRHLPVHQQLIDKLQARVVLQVQVAAGLFGRVNHCVGALIAARRIRLP